MAISCANLYLDVASQLGEGVGNTRLANGFVRALNRALSELGVKADKASNFGSIASTDDTISDLNEKYEYIIYAGVMFNLIRMGHRPSDPKLATVVYEDSRKAWNDGKADYIVDLDNVIQSDADNDVIGLGSLE